MALKIQRRPVRTDSARFFIARVRSRWCTHTLSTQLGCRWRGLSRMFAIVLMVQSLAIAAAVRPELAPFSGSGAGETQDPAPTQPPTVSSSITTASPPAGNRGIIIERESARIYIGTYASACRLVCVALASMRRLQTIICATYRYNCACV